MDTSGGGRVQPSHEELSVAPIQNVCLFFRTSHSDSSIYIRRHSNRSLETVSMWISLLPCIPANRFLSSFLLPGPELWDFWCIATILLDRRLASRNLVIKHRPTWCPVGTIGDINKVMILKPEGLYVIKKKIKIQDTTPSPAHPPRKITSKMGTEEVEGWLHVHNCLTLDVLGPEHDGPQLWFRWAGSGASSEGSGRGG